jgi:hypothetical protein
MQHQTHYMNYAVANVCKSEESQDDNKKMHIATSCLRHTNYMHNGQQGYTEKDLRSWTGTKKCPAGGWK